MFESSIKLVGKKFFKRKDVIRTISKHSAWSAFFISAPSFAILEIAFVLVNIVIQYHMFYRLCKLAHINIKENIWRILLLVIGVTIVCNSITIVVDVLIEILQATLVSMLPIVGWVLSFGIFSVQLFINYLWFWLAGKSFVYMLKWYFNLSALEDPDAEQEPNDYMDIALLSFLFCPVTGVFSIKNAFAVSPLYDKGRYEESKQASKKAKLYSIYGFCIGALIATCVILIMWLFTKNL